MPKIICPKCCGYGWHYQKISCTTTLTRCEKCGGKGLIELDSTTQCSEGLVELGSATQ